MTEQAFSKRVPEGDDHERRVCDTCGFIDYENPKIVCGSVVMWREKYLLCRRAIDPRDGFWTLPAGFMELGESAEDGAVREAWEEARARITIDQLLAVYSIPRISQVQLMYRARLENPDVEPGPESREVALFTWDEIPWTKLAFPSVYWALHQHRDVMDQKTFPPFITPTGELGDINTFLKMVGGLGV